MSKIIKGAPRQFEEIVPFDFVQLESQRKKAPSHAQNRIGMLSGAQEEPDPVDDPEARMRGLFLEAERKAQELEEEAYRKGYEQGQKDGFEFGLKSMSIVKEHLEGLLDQFQTLPETLLQEYRDWLIEMCLGISRRIVRRELETDSSQLSQLIDNLLSEAAEEHTLTVYVHPHDLDLLEKHLDLKSTSERTGRTFSLKADPRLDRGGCRLESDIQLFDASIEKQFAFIEKALRNDGSDSDHLLT